MLLGIEALSVRPLSSVPSGLDVSTPDVFKVLKEGLARAEPTTYLLDVTPWDDTAEAETVVRASDRGFVSDGADTPAHTPWPARIEAPLTVAARMFDGPEPTGRASRDDGTITVLNGDGALDGWADYFWDGRGIELRLGRKTDALADFGFVWKGRAEALEWDDQAIAVRAADLGARLDQSVNQTTYAGTGGLEGPEELEGRPKPVGFGLVRNAEPVLVSGTFILYQINDGPIEEVIEVRDAGVPLINEGDVEAPAEGFLTTGKRLAALAFGDHLGITVLPEPDGELDSLDRAILLWLSQPGGVETGDLVTTPISGGAYKTDLSRGLIRLGAVPAGQLTVDFKGDNSGGYVDDAAGIVRRIVTKRLGASSLADPTELDPGSFARIAAAQPAAMGYFSSGDVDASTVLDEIMTGIGGTWGFSRLGGLELRILEAPASGGIALDPSNVESIELLASSPPAWRRRVGWRRNWTVQREADLAGSVDAADRDFYAAETRWAITSVEEEVQQAHINARDAVTPALFDSQTDAETETARLDGLHGSERSRYRVTVLRGALRFWLGTKVNLTWPRWDLGGGKDFIVIAIEHDMSDDTAALELWG